MDELIDELATELFEAKDTDAECIALERRLFDEYEPWVVVAAMMEASEREDDEARVKAMRRLH